MHFIFSTGSLYTYGTDRCFEFAQQAGFDGIELMIDHRWDTRQTGYVQSLIDRFGLPVRAVHSPFPGHIHGWAADLPDAIEKSVHMAETLGATVVILHLPDRVSFTPVQFGRKQIFVPLPWPRRHELYIRWVQEGMPRLQASAEVLLAIENLPAKRFFGRKLNPAVWNAHSRATISDITRFPHITLDTTHLGTWGLDPAEVFVRWGERVKHIHLSNFNGREHRRPEDGHLRLDRFLARVAAAGYAHSVSLELHPDALDAGQDDDHVVALMADSLANVEPGRRSPDMRSRILRVAQPVLMLLALLFIGILVQSQWQELRAHDWQFHAGWLLFSGGLMIGSWFVEVAIWRMALACVGGSLGYASAVRIWFASILVRYIPGNVWQPLGMTVLARQVGVRPEATVMSIALYQAVNLLSVVPLVSVYLLWWGEDSPLLALLGNLSTGLAWLAAGAVALLILRPGWLIGLLNWALIKVGRPALPAVLTSRQLLWLLTVAVGDWLLWGGAFAALTFALHPLNIAEQAQLLPHLLVAYPVAYALGYLSFITPGGLAVREGALVLLLSPFLGGVATVAALAMRLWQVIWEVVVAGAVAGVVKDTKTALQAEDIGY